MTNVEKSEEIHPNFAAEVGFNEAPRRGEVDDHSFKAGTGGRNKKLSSEVKKIQKCSEPIRTTSPQKLEKKGNPTKESRYIPSAIKNYVWQRDGGRCNYMNHQIKRQCNSTYMLQVDHIQPFAYGGSSKAENLRLSCAAHNQARMALESSSCRRR